MVPSRYNLAGVLKPQVFADFAIWIVTAVRANATF
jgi:hypothetical protein